MKFNDNISEIWSSMMLFDSEITVILVLVDDNCKVSGERKHGKNHVLNNAKNIQTRERFQPAKDLRRNSMLFLGAVAWEITKYFD